jgi:HSP20 family molecular chaperone IbpA
MMTDDDHDDYEDFYGDIIDQFKKYFKIDPNLSDVDFFFIPEPINFDFDAQDPNIKGFKVSYHFESGMDKPEIRIESDIDKKEIGEYLKGIKIQENPNFKIMRKDQNQREEIDASEFSLTPCVEEVEDCSLEPYSEIHYLEDSVEIILEVPGVEKGHIILSLSNDGRKLKISAKNTIRNFEKEFKLPFRSTLERHVMEINNGLASIIINKRIP